MYTCKTCNKTFEKKESLGGHRGIHRKRFEDLKKDEARKRRLIVENGHVCWICKNSVWMEKQIPLTLDHIDGNSDNSSRENLRIVCPNCHAQTSTFAGKNKGKISGTKRQSYMKKYRNVAQSG